MSKRSINPEKRIVHIAAVVLAAATVAATVSTLVDRAYEDDMRCMGGECVAKDTNYLALRTNDGHEWELDTAAYAVSKGDVVVIEFDTLGTEEKTDDIIIGIRRVM